MHTATHRLRPAGLLAAGIAAGCSGPQSALDPGGPHARLLAELWWVVLAVSTAVTLLVFLLLLMAIRRSAGKRTPRPLGSSRSRQLVIGGGLILPLAVVIPFAVSSFSIARVVDGPAPPDALTVEVEGRLWWWEVHYRDGDGNRIATGANEIHIPVGRPVRFLLRSDNVIHSFWVPNLQGKKDMVPGTVNSSWLQADRPGVYRGQCAEFCGVQHGLMAFEVVAESPDAFAAWLERQRLPARVPRTREAARGKEVFFTASCSDCHTIRGTAADGEEGPDLTHVAGRRTLAAATVPNRVGYLGGWITDPQHIKPGNKMPATNLSPAGLKALIAYLETLE